MTNKIIESFSTQVKQSLESVNKVGALMQGNMEKLADLQMQSFRTYSELATKQWKALANARDLEGLKAFGETQTEIATEIGKKVMADLKELSELGAQLKEEIEKVINKKDDSGQA